MEREELTEVLRDAGLSPYQADAYVALLDLGASPATAVAEASSVPDPRIYDVLRDLEQQGYVETYQQGSLHARAHDPKEVLTDLRDRAERFSEAAEAIEDRWNRPEMKNNKVSIVKRFETVIDRADTLIRSAENQIQLCANPKQFATLRDALEGATERGVDVKLSLYTSPEERATLPDQSSLAGACTEARHRTVPSPFLALIDRTWTCFAPHNRSVNQYGVLVDDRTHAFVFHWFFQTCLWEVWETIYSDRPDEPPVTYVNLRQCVRDIQPFLEAEAEVDVVVEGYRTDTGNEITVEGRLVGTEYPDGSNDLDEPPLSQLVGQVYIIVVDDSGNEYTIGGWGAVLEEIEATRITVQDVREQAEHVADD